MNDRELLELAAKAAGIIGEWVERYGSGEYYYQGNAEGVLYELPGGGWSVWNPLADDGDALRLAVKLGISFGVGAESKRMRVVWFIGDELHSMDMPANHHIALPPPRESEWVRRAIVRAAAAIGEAL